MLDEVEIKQNRLRWMTRRKMAWYALISIYAVMFLVIFVVPSMKIKVLAEILSWFFMVMGGIVGGYIGASTMDDIKAMDTKKTQGKEKE